MTSSATELMGLQEDLRAIRESLERHNRLTIAFLRPENFAWLSLGLGLGLVLTLGGLHIAVSLFGSLLAVPLPLQGTLWVILAGLLVFGATFKSRLLFNLGTPSGLGPAEAIRLLLRPAWEVYVSAILTLIGLAFVLFWQGLPLLLIALAAPVLGIVWNHLGGLSGWGLYKAMALWFLVVGPLTGPWVTGHPFAAAAVIYGGGFTLFGLFALLTPKTRHAHQS